MLTFLQRAARRVGDCCTVALGVDPGHTFQQEHSVNKVVVRSHREVAASARPVTGDVHFHHLVKMGSVSFLCDKGRFFF